MEQLSALIIEDDGQLADVLARFLRRQGFDVETAADARTALEKMFARVFDIVLSDIRLPDRSGIEVLQEIKRAFPQTIVLMMTAFSSIDSAVEAVRLGADDYLSKPLQLDDVKMRIERALERRRLQARVADLQQQLTERYRFGNIIGKSKPMQELFRVLERVARSSATVLIVGRTGTGKELVARAIHYNSPRANGPFVDINCGALPAELLESELFGHVRGAFTGATESRPGLFEVAHGGTLFLDEVDALKPDLQVKLLRALQEKVIRRVGGRENIPVDVRIIAATNQDLEEAVRRGEFREDLYYRLNVVTLYLPELRERREDIPLLVEHFLERYARENGQPLRRFSTEAMRLLMSYSWPGNVRELQNAVEYALTMSSEPILTIRDLPPHISGIAPLERSAPPEREPRTLAEVEKRHILRILEETGGNHAKAAEILGIDRRTLYRKLQKYQIPLESALRGGRSVGASHEE
ncbi:MAG: sigma-54 dependent transcriptional regulator [Blastocatellia bacterium]|nr:sigma-54 dependent transcriptional regulator [Blastocatellia bacterium]MCS7156225.1 sigma-54 dependent transcriptional regulator [Blastocatellia bacterium]MCX7751425.1 sigma-54 dependent transcriptional regulator [Blastocatellia bacterium]MDW8169138.1 sigma-54 dependent transcriptional regulator [Acidobacteriota bacterium]MDW8255999.1 sigma-54 dependent transcriptional regulator [Acidobacteriota bacterium]